MKLRIKIVAAFILLSLLSVICYQIYWISNSYKEQLSNIEVDVTTAMRDADYREISWRIDLIRLDAAIKRDSSSYSRVDIPRWEDAHDMQIYLQKDLHKSVGRFRKSDFPVFSNLLQVELTRKGITLESFAEMIDLKNNKVLESSIQNDTSLIKRSLYRQYIFPFDLDGVYAYRLNLKQPELFVLKKMSGILIGSLLLIVIIVFSYFYLYKIILRQKSIDEIKSDFVNNMTHELKTPISVVYAATDALLNFGMMNDPQKRLQYLQISKEQLSRLSSLVEQILTISVEERKNLKLVTEQINLSELFIHLKNQYLLNNTKKKIEFEIDVQPENLIINVDKIHFPNSIGNLIENSIKYSGDNVRIILSAQKSEEKIIISIKDNGIGIPAASLPKIFDRFYRVSTGNIHDVKGYGLGLYYVKTIIERHKGKISVKSKEGEGTEFIIQVNNEQ